MTCKEALKARYKVVGRKENGYSEAAVYLSYEEARRFWDSLTFREFDSIKVIAYWDEHVFYNEEQALKALDKLHKENGKGMKELADDSL